MAVNKTLCGVLGVFAVAAATGYSVMITRSIKHSFAETRESLEGLERSLNGLADSQTGLSESFEAINHSLDNLAESLGYTSGLMASPNGAFQVQGNQADVTRFCTGDASRRLCAVIKKYEEHGLPDYGPAAVYENPEAFRF